MKAGYICILFNLGED